LLRWRKHADCGRFGDATKLMRCRDYATQQDEDLARVMIIRSILV
jgi:hypothetical protein